MNSLYIGIGVAIIMALVTALVGPYFVDWTAYRSVFEREGQRIFGERVTVLGNAQVRLLPAPSILLDDVVIGPVDHPDLKIDRLDLKLELTPLLKGDVRISELRLDRPVVRLGIESDGKFALPGRYATFGTASGAAGIGAIGLEFAEIVDGRIMLFDERTGTETAIDALNGTASAAELAGPLKLDGGARIGGHAFNFRFATGKRGDDGKWPLRLQASPVDAPLQVGIEAVLDTLADAPVATGTFHLERLALGEGKADKLAATPTPWQLDTDFSASTAAITVEGTQISVGDAETAYKVTGHGKLDLGSAPRFDVDLAARQIDLDRLIAQKIDEPADPQVATRRLREMLFALPKLPMAGKLHLGVGGLVLGGGAIQDLDLAVRTRADGWAIDQMSAKLPGRSQVGASGRLTVPGIEATEASFVGDLLISSEQPSPLIQWWTKSSPGKAPVALDPFKLSGHAEIASGALRIDQLDAEIGAAKARGNLIWSAASGGKPDRLKASLSADRLDLDQAKLMLGLVSGNLAPDSVSTTSAAHSSLRQIDLDLDAGTVVIGGQSLKSVTTKAGFDGSTLTIEQLRIQDALGASIDVHGRVEKVLTTPDGALDGSIRAERLTGLAHLVEVLSRDSAGSTLPWLKRFLAAAPTMGPFKADAHLTGVASAASSKIHVQLDGMAAVSKLSLLADFDGRLDRFRDGRLDTALKFDGPDGGLILRQIGFAAISDATSAGKLLISAKGVPSDGLVVIANAEIAGAKLTSTGHAHVDAGGIISYDADAHFVTSDVRTPLMMLGQALPSGGSTVPIDVQARIDGQGLKVRLSNLTGHIVEAGSNGTISVDFGQSPTRLDGDLQLTKADLTTFLELGLGNDAFELPVAKDAIWSTEVLKGPVFSAINANIGLKADRLGIDPARGIDRFATKLRLRPGQVLFDEVNGSFAGGDLTGALSLTASSDAAIALVGNVQLKQAHVADVVWRRDDRAVADGAMDLNATFESSGRSIAALASALSGNGALTVMDGRIRYVDPDAFSVIIAAADNGLELKDDKIRAIFQGRLDAGTLPFSRVEAAFAIGSGVLRANAINVTSQRAQAGGSLALDFGRWTMDADWTLKVDPGKNGVVGAEPQVGVLFRGPLDAPKRTLDVAPLSAFLTLRAFEREVQRVEDLQADIVEQQRFQRELKRLKDLRIQREQEQKAAEAAARQKVIDDKKAEEARQAAEAKAAEEARKAADAKRLEDARKADEANKANTQPTPASAPVPVRPAPASGPELPSSSEAAKPSPVGAPDTAANPVVPEAAKPPVSVSTDAQQIKMDVPVRKPEPPLSLEPPAGAIHDPAVKPAMPLPINTSPSADAASQAGATQSVREKRRIDVLPDLPPIIFITPRPPIMPLNVPNSPSAQ